MAINHKITNNQKYYFYYTQNRMIIHISINYKILIETFQHQIHKIMLL